MKKVLLTFSMIFLAMGIIPLWGQIPQSEKEALITLYNSTNGAEWLEEFRWDLSQTPDKWSGVVVKDGHVIALMLNSAELNGTLPEGIFSALPELEALALDQNPNLKGTVPSDLVSLKKLQILSITYCGFTGELPSLDGFKELILLNLSMLNQKKDPNGFTSTMPDFANMPHLQYFDASFAGMKGQISEGIGNCKDLDYFDISGNNIEGSLPASLNNCVKLKDFSVQDNKLSGEIPDLSAITGITFDIMNGYFGRFFLNDNQFTGRFPMWIASLNDVKRMSFANNQLEGSLPDNLGTLLELESFYADHNNLSGDLPKQLPPKLENLDLSNNQLTGSLPAEWSKATNLNSIVLTNNELSGKVGLDYKKLSELETVRVSFNRFTFADFEAWDGFAKDELTRFYFGLQKPYSQKSEVKVSSGETAKLDATIPVEQPTNIKLTYKWYNTATMEEIPNSPNAPIFELQNAEKAMAHGYICLVTTDHFGDDPTGELSENSIQMREAQEEILTPMLASGRITLYVDGYTDTNSVKETKEAPYVYPTHVEDLLHVAHAEAVESLWIFNSNGEKVSAQKLHQDEAVSLAHLPQGTYWVMLLTHSGETYTTPIIR